MRKFIIAMLSMMSMVILSLAMLYTYDVYLPFTLINGNNVGWKTSDAVYKSIVNDLPSNIVITFGEDVVLDAEYITYPYPNELDLTLQQWLSGQDLIVDLEPAFNPKLHEDLESLHVPSSNAYIDLTEDGYTLVPEVIGCDFNVDEVYRDITEGKFVIALDDYVTLPDITEDNLLDDFNKVEWLNSFVIDYSNGSMIKGISLSQYMNDGELSVPDEFFNPLMDELVNAYDTSEKTWFFTPTGATEPVELFKSKWSTLGAKVNEDKELEFIKQSLADKTSSYGRVPFKSGYDTLDGTYVEISIDKQHLWYYKDNVLVDETDIVTGHKGVHDTPRGVYYISECLRNKTLRGDGYASFVYYWMRLTNSGIGLHDATWRSKFGNNIYTYNGSHGCLNLPKSFAAMLYAEAYVGMPVIIY